MCTSMVGILAFIVFNFISWSLIMTMIVVWQKTDLLLLFISAQEDMTAIERSKLKEQKPLQTLIANKLSKDDESVMVNLKCAYYLAKQELPKHEMKHQVEFVNFVAGNTELKNTVDGFNMTDPSYTCNKSVSEFQTVI